MRPMLVVIVTLLSCLPMLAECTAAEKKALEELDRAWAEANRTGDRAALQRVIGDDFTGFNPSGTQTKTEAVDSAMEAFEAVRSGQNPPPQLAFDQYMISCTATTATVTHRTTITANVDGQEQTNYARSVHVLEKRGGRWQVISTTAHPVNDAGMLQYMEREWNDALVNKDTRWFERNFARDYSSISSRSGSLRNKSQDIEEVKASTITSAELSDINVRVNGDTAVVTGVNRVRGRDKDGKSFDDRLRFTDVFIKRDGRWQVWASQGTRIQG